MVRDREGAVDGDRLVAVDLTDDATPDLQWCEPALEDTRKGAFDQTLEPPFKSP